MATPESNTLIEDDALHLGSGTKLTAEEIAKAVAHHNRHHGGEKPKDAAAQAATGKNKQAPKPGKK